MFVYRNSPRKLIALTKDAWQMFASSLLRVIWLSAAMALISDVLMVVQRVAMTQPQEHLHGHPWLVASLFAAPIVMVLITIYFTIVMMRVMHLQAKGHAVSLAHLLREAMRVRLFWTVFRAMAIGFILMALGIYFYVIPGLLVIVFLAVLLPSIVIDDLKVWAALKQSSRLVWHHFFFTIGLFILPAAVAILCAILLDRIVPMGVTRLLFDWLIATLMTPWIYATQLVLLRELKWRYKHAYEN